jgi:N-methylhydantoinase B
MIQTIESDRYTEIVQGPGPMPIHSYGAERSNACTDALLDQAERLARNAIRAMPDGRYAFEDWIDDDATDPGPIPIRVTITVAGDRLLADFTGTAPQVKRAVNSPLPCTKSAVFACVRHLIGGDPPTTKAIFGRSRSSPPKPRSSTLSCLPQSRRAA